MSDVVAEQQKIAAYIRVMIAEGKAEFVEIRSAVSQVALGDLFDNICEALEELAVEIETGDYLRGE